MSLRLLSILAVLLSGCATGPVPAAPVCDGRDRRPANPHGSVLASPPPGPQPAPAAPETDAPAAGGCA